ncbi:MAG: cyclic nucleotide-binding domain-containing protein [Desulfovibrionaceae bacterium]
MAAGQPNNLKTLNRGAVILREGQVSPAAFVVKKGSVVLFRVVNNRRVVLGHVTPGQMFGEWSLLSGNPFEATAEAADYCELMPMDRDVLQGLLLKCPNPVQRIVKNLMEQVARYHGVVRDQPSTDIFFSVCQLLELMHRQPCAAPEPGMSGVSHAAFVRTVKNILCVTQLEIDHVLHRLQRLGVVAMHAVKQASFAADALGKVGKTREMVRDKCVTIKDPEEFLAVARNLSAELQRDPPFTEGMAFVDIHDFAAMAKTTPHMIYRKMAHQEVPENLFFLPRGAAEAWIGQVGEAFFQKLRRRTLNLDELETVDDLVFVDAPTLRQVVEAMSFHTLATLFAAAGEDARDKLLAILSKKMAAIIQEEAAGRDVDEAELAGAEDELFALVKKIKGAGK